ncbi:hypothetical protein ACET3Z_014844 [Daucus carota]
MFITLHYSVPYSILSVYSCANNKTNKHNSKGNNTRQANQLSIQKSSPTPLIINQKTYPRTKLEALDAVVKDLETSVKKGIQIDTQTFCSILESCYNLQGIDYVSRIHRLIPENLLRRNVGVSCKLIRMYAVSGLVDEAHQVFDKMSQRDVYAFPWNALISGYAELGYVRHELLREALHVFRLMIKEAFEPDSVSLSTILACALPKRVGAEIHGWVLRRGAECNLSVANSLIVWYSNNNRLDRATWLFDQMSDRDVVSWNSIISAYGKHPDALKYFKKMRSTDVCPDRVTFVSLLSTCAHLGMVKDGEMLFSMMRDKYRITPIMEHYACMVNLYGRANLINKAYDTIKNQMEFEPGPTVWGALLYACYLHGNVDVGAIAAANLFELESDNEHNFEILMNMYKNAGRLEDVQRVKSMMEERGLD